jgi:hypothetical protein
MVFSAPEITDTSNPNKKPPNAAMSDTRTAYPDAGLLIPVVGVDVAITAIVDIFYNYVFGNQLLNNHLTFVASHTCTTYSLLINHLA